MCGTRKYSCSIHTNPEKKTNYTYVYNTGMLVRLQEKRKI